MRTASQAAISPRCGLLAAAAFRWRLPQPRPIRRGAGAGPQPQAAWIAGGTGSRRGPESQAARPPTSPWTASPRCRRSRSARTSVRIGACVPLREIETRPRRPLRTAGRDVALVLPHARCAIAPRSAATSALPRPSATCCPCCWRSMPAWSAAAFAASAVCPSPNSLPRLPPHCPRRGRADRRGGAVRAPARDRRHQGGQAQTDDISIVAASFVIDRDAQGRAPRAPRPHGGVAATPRRALAAGGLPARQEPGRRHAGGGDGAAPSLHAISLRRDARAGADYRRAPVRQPGFTRGLHRRGASGMSAHANRSAATKVPWVTSLGGRSTPTSCIRRASPERSGAGAHAHARLRGGRRARRAGPAGVLAVLTAADVPGENETGTILRDGAADPRRYPAVPRWSGGGPGGGRG